MRTSPSHVRRAARVRAPAVLLAAVLVLAAAACGGDDDEATTPTTTAPAGPTTTGTTEAGGGDETTTTTAAGGTPEPGTPTTVAGDDAEVLSTEEASAQLQVLLDGYRSALVQIRESGAIDERALRVLSGSFTSAAARGEVAGLRQVGGVGVLNPSPPALAASEVTLTEATATCASGTVVVSGLDQVTTTPVALGSPHHYRLVPAPDGASAPGWRLDFLRFSADGSPLEEARC